MEIIRKGNCVQFTHDGKQSVFPIGSLILIASDNSESINVRLISSRKNVLTFNVDQLTNPTASTATEAVELISSIIN